MEILLATGNRGKAREIESILHDAGADSLKLLLPIDMGFDDSPIESGHDYETNSIIKARFYGDRSGIVAIADDSGLEVDALDGFPGIKSARVKAYEDSDKARYETLLDLMRDIPPDERTAKFVCVATAYFPDTNRIISTRGEWSGIILECPDGEKGFGYDPVFFDPVADKSAAHMTPEEKNVYSHRGKAFRELWESIKVMLL